VAAEVKPDYLIGGTLIEPVQEILAGTGIRFFPYVSQIVGHPCLLRGSIEEIVADTERAAALGVDGINLLAYRYDFIGTNVDVRMFVDPSLTNTPPNASAAATLSGLCGFGFDWVEVGSGSESLDIDELRIATTFAEAAPLDLPKLSAQSTNNAMRVILSGLPGRNYAIERTADFLAWSTMTNGLSDTNGLLQFDDTNFPATSPRFYRGVFP